ncbi:hypothetical protein C0584_03475 [Candidatus Parcubacteria bacterium]|nr:MAG: hypothetical protein C0584_03475 [Candidatus Parcubacteria bacterium]
MRIILQYILKILAKLVLLKYKPVVIGVTGSVGKTTTKEAIHTVLSKKYRVGKSLKNYNNELGLPLSILGFESPGKNIIAWIVLFTAVLKSLFKKDKFYPEILVLEMGIDRPGDMDYLNKITKANIGVVTNIGMSHMEYFGTIDRIKKEKSKLITNLEKKGLAVINYDNEKSREIIELSKERVVSFGLDKKADIRAEEVKIILDRENKDYTGMHFKIRYKGSVVPVFIKGFLGHHLIYSSMAAAVIGVELGMNLIEISEALQAFRSPRGRLRILEGVNNSTLIDDTYNSSPQSTQRALELMDGIEIEKSRKIVILGDMLELGEDSESEHRKIGNLVSRSKVDILVCIGDLSQNTYEGAVTKMGKDKCFYFQNKKESLNLLKDININNDIVLIKGSQGARMEKLVKILLKDRAKAKNLLVRQETEWQA